MGLIHKIELMRVILSVKFLENFIKYAKYLDNSIVQEMYF